MITVLPDCKICVKSEGEIEGTQSLRRIAAWYPGKKVAGFRLAPEWYLFEKFK